MKSNTKKKYSIIIKATLLLIGSILYTSYVTSIYAATISATYQYDNLDRLEKAEFVGAGYSASFTYTYDDSGNLLNVWIESTGSTFIDTDKDGMDDDWERSYFNNLSTANAITDSDGDGYLDIWEYLNWKEGILDPDGFAFDPTVANAAGGRGYKVGINSSFWTLMLPAILSGAESNSH